MAQQRMRDNIRRIADMQLELHQKFGERMSGNDPRNAEKRRIQEALAAELNMSRHVLQKFISSNKALWQPHFAANAKCLQFDPMPPPQSKAGRCEHSFPLIVELMRQLNARGLLARRFRGDAEEQEKTRLQQQLADRIGVSLNTLRVFITGARARIEAALNQNAPVSMPVEHTPLEHLLYLFAG